MKLKPLHLRKRSRVYTIANNMLKNPYILLLPAIVLTLVFTYYPLIYAITTSFYSWDVFSGKRVFIGLGNYLPLLTNLEFLQALKNTLVYTVSTIGLGLLFQLFVGLFLNRPYRIYNLIQTIVFTPYILPSVAITVIWSWLMAPTDGVFNYFLGLLNREPSLFLKGFESAMPSVIFISLWGGLGYGILIIISGLRRIPAYVYEAASLDRSDSFTTLSKITLPLLQPTLFFLFITGTISSFLAFDTIKLLTNGGPDGATTTLAFHVYQTGFVFFRVGEAMSMAVIQMIIVLGISIVNFIAMKNMLVKESGT